MARLWYFCGPLVASARMRGILWACARQAQDSGESVRIMDDLMYALDGLSAKLPASTQQESAIAIAETALTQRGRMALRSALSRGTKADVAPCHVAPCTASCAHIMALVCQALLTITPTAALSLLPCCRSDGAIADVLKAADRLPLARDPLVAAALAALLLCFSRTPLDQQVLVTPPAMSLLGKLLQVAPDTLPLNWCNCCH